MSNRIKKTFDDFAKRRYQKPRVIVLDNGPIHYAKAVKNRFEEWENDEMFVFFLPIYSPHLNGSGQPSN